MWKRGETDCVVKPKLFDLGMPLSGFPSSACQLVAQAVAPDNFSAPIVLASASQMILSTSLRLGGQTM